MKRRTANAAQTAGLGAALGEVAEPGIVIGLVGDLGAGKTLFVQGLACGLGVAPEVRVVSPTFTLINEYPGGRAALHHADLYRLERESELDEIGLDEVMRGDGVVAIEWADRFDILPADSLVVRITVASDTERELEATARGPLAERVLAAWSAASRIAR